MNTHDVLHEVVKKISCKPGWDFTLQYDESLHCVLVIEVPGPDSRREGQLNISHYFPAPEATYNFKSWRRWIFECCRKVEDHELGEWFLVNGERPFAPLHGPGNDPYTIRELSTDEEVRTDQQGNL